MHDLKVWSCGHCSYTLDLPPEDNYAQYIDALERVREHRFGHLADAMMSATDEELHRLCEDEPGSSEPVEAEDAAYVLAGVAELLKADLPRARKCANLSG